MSSESKNGNKGCQFGYHMVEGDTYMAGIRKQTENRFLNMYQIDALDQNGKV